MPLIQIARFLMVESRIKPNRRFFLRGATLIVERPLSCLWVPKPAFSALRYQTPAEPLFRAYQCESSAVFDDGFHVDSPYEPRACASAAAYKARPWPTTPAENCTSVA
jgi:hypothetical protein